MAIQAHAADMVEIRVAARLSQSSRPLPGLAVVALGVGIAYGVHALLPPVGLLTAAVLLGVGYANVGLHHETHADGLRVATTAVLRTGVVLLGLGLAVGDVVHLGAPLLLGIAITVAATFLGTQWIGRRLGLSHGTSLMVATGFSICGASAIAAMRSVGDADEDDVVTGVALVTTCGTAALALMPLLGGWLGMDPTRYGAWVGASVHEVGQVVAAAAPVGGALAIAVVVKLTRVVLLAPMVAIQSVVERRRSIGATGERPPLVPVFVLGFLAMIAVRSTGLVPSGVLTVAADVQNAALAAALFGLGAGVRWSRLRRTGARAFALGAASWLIVLVVSLGAVTMAH